MDAREERLARNEILFRDINEQVGLVATPQGTDAHVYEFFCECSNLDCTLRLRMTLEFYESVRADPTLFVVAPGHELPEIEVVVQRTDDYQVVKKLNGAARLATAEDPRS